MSSCPHFSIAQIPSCLALTSAVFKDAKSFVTGGKSVREIQTLFPLIAAGCISRDLENNSIRVNSSKCIGCGFCIAGCPSRSFALTDSMVPISRCGSGLKVSTELVEFHKSDNLSDRVFLKLSTALTHAKSIENQSFASFTSSDEVKNLSPWAAQIAAYICGEQSEIGLEVNIDIEDKPRAGRLDVCIRSEHGVFIFESKKSFKSMMTEDRIFDQFLDYRLELDQISSDADVNPLCHLFVLIGGDETDLFPLDHPDCSSFDADNSRRMYKWLMENNAKMISAQGLLWLAFRDFSNQSPSSIEVLKSFYLNSSAHVLTSRGCVCLERGNLIFKNLQNLKS
jgi:ferredoxin